ncbi:MAG: SRPBCC family protein [Candidatus Hodarchaeales archaeon]|jgi:uncharacterized protein YndB with AHSA1/START domain
MADMIHGVTIESDIKKVYSALINQEELNKWWTHDVKAEPKVDSVLEFGFMSHQVVFKMKVLDLKDFESVTWACIEGPPEWKNTNVKFNLKQEDSGTFLRFVHSDWKSTDNMFGPVNYQWALYLKSLKEFVETGKGEPNTS